jgi:A/G-specific adenine glycosylase
MNKKAAQFVEAVWEYYRAYGRHDLPWRKTHDPYKILVSEVMLQQTQVVRVVPKYRAFLKQFPSTKVLAEASLGDVLRAWQGLGYNRRAKFLKEAAAAVHYVHCGRWPRTQKELQALPGVGSYTAAALMNFAYNEPVPLIETNIRTVYLHHFYTDALGVPDAALWPYIEATFDTTHPRDWCYALMDYGAHLKETIGNLNVKSAQYKKQSPFKGSGRQIRGSILRLLASDAYSETSLFVAVRSDSHRPELTKNEFKIQLDALVMETMVVKEGCNYTLVA